MQANMLIQFFYPYKYVELLDCLLQPESIYRLVRLASRIRLSRVYTVINDKYSNNEYRITILLGLSGADT